jgi:hypothetical protein
MHVTAPSATHKLTVIQPESGHVLAAGACDFERLRGRQFARATSKYLAGTFQKNAH